VGARHDRGGHRQGLLQVLPAAHDARDRPALAGVAGPRPAAGRPRARPAEDVARVRRLHGVDDRDPARGQRRGPGRTRHARCAQAAAAFDRSARLERGAGAGGAVGPARHPRDAAAERAGEARTRVGAARRAPARRHGPGQPGEHADPARAAAPQRPALPRAARAGSRTARSHALPRGVHRGAHARAERGRREAPREAGEGVRRDPGIARPEARRRPRTLRTNAR
jgi:hypothetical protein